MPRRTKPSDGKTGTVAQWAARCGIRVQAAYKRIKTADIPQFADGRLDFETADRLWNAARTGKHSNKGRDKAIYEGTPGGTGTGTGTAAGVGTGGNQEDSLGEDLSDFHAAFDGNGHSISITPITPTTPGTAEQLVSDGVHSVLGGNLDNLNAQSLIEYLQLSHGKAHGQSLPPRVAADYAMKMVQLEGEITDLRKTIQNLVPLNVVRDFESRVLTDLRGALIPIGGELRDDLASSADPVRCQKLVDDRIYGALRQVSQFNPKSKSGE